jgi:hypothetical protein
MSAADGFLAPGAPHAELERRYRRLLGLYPREFRARHADEMIGMLMASAADGQDRPARGDARDIVRGSLLARLRGPRGGWPFALSAFALVAPWFLVLADILQVAFPYSQGQAAARGRVSVLEAHGVPAGGMPMLSQPAFLILVAGHLIVAAAVLAGLRRTALAALVIAAVADYTQWTAFHVLSPGAGTIAFLTIAVFLLEAIALAAADPRSARRREGWQHAFPALALAVAAQPLALSFHASGAGGMMLTGCVLALLAVLLPLPLGLGWRASLARGRLLSARHPAHGRFRPIHRLAAPDLGNGAHVGTSSTHGHRDHPVPAAAASPVPGREPGHPHEPDPRRRRPGGLAGPGPGPGTGVGKHVPRSST